MTEQDRDQAPISEGPAPHDETRRSHPRITGFSDLVPDWILPPESKQHMRNARKEMLLAVRGVLDRAIECQEAGPAPRRTVSRVEID